MKRKDLIFRFIIILIPVIALGIAISLSVAWYINTIRTGTIDASTKNVSLSYSLTKNNVTSSNVSNYNIDNLAFFDIDNTDETSYFDEMCLTVTLTITNKSNSDMTYTVTFTSPKREYSKDEVVVSKSYVACYYAKSPQTTIAALATNGTVSGNTVTYTNSTESFIVINRSQDGALKASGNQNDTVTLTFYLIGVQEMPDATNTDFLYTEAGSIRSLTNHQFSISIIGEPISNSQAEENED